MHALSREAKLERLSQQGISLKDLEEEYKLGFTAGFDSGVKGIYKTCYAATALALHELHKFGHKRCQDVLQRIDDLICEYLTTEEAIDDVWRKVGLEMDFNSGVNRIQEADEVHPWRNKRP